MKLVYSTLYTDVNLCLSSTGNRAQTVFVFSVFQQSIWKSVGGDKDLLEPETIVVKGEEHSVPQRPDHSLSNDFLAASFWVSICALHKTVRVFISFNGDSVVQLS